MNSSSRSAAKPTNSRRRDDDAGATPNQPTVSVVSAHITDAAALADLAKPEPAEEAPPGVTPEATEHADAGIQVPGYTTGRARRVVVVRRKRRRPKKVSGPLDNLPF